MAEEETEEKKGGKGKLIIIIVAAVVLLGGGGGAAFFLMGGSDEEEVAAAEGEAAGPAGAAPAAKAEAQYFSISPAFVTNFQAGDAGRMRYLKVEVQGMTRDINGFALLEKHMPLMRNSLVMLFSRQVYDDLLTPEGKEALRQEALAELQAKLEEETGTPIVEDLYFTSFVMQ